MTKTNLLTVFVVTFAVAMLGIASVTPVFAVPVLNPANGNHYEFISTTLSWTDAKSAAEAAVFEGVNGHLVTITSASENAFVEFVVPDNKRVWIGLTDEVTEDTFLWVTGEPVIYTNFSPGEPNNNNNNEDHVEFLGEPDFSSTWNDVPIDFVENDGYVVEYEPTHSSLFDILEGILGFVQSIQTDITSILNILENEEEVSVRDNLFVTDIALKDGQVIVLLDNAGAGGSSDVEVTWRLDNKKCQLLYTFTDVAALTPFVDDDELSGNPAHQDLTAVEAIALTTQEGKSCNVDKSQGEYIGISTIGSSP